jgi:8-oxo-dGTP pyrophosphatase MutT (NUDIX family)
MGKTEAKMKRRYRKAVFAVIYCREKGKVEYLILRRKHHWKGWEFTKGGRNKFELKRWAARREAREESGLKPIRIKRFNYSGKYKYSREFSDRKGFIGQTFTLFAAEVRKGKVKVDKKEHSGFKWMNFKQALRSVKFANQKKSLKIVNNWISKR